MKTTIFFAGILALAIITSCSENEISDEVQYESTGTLLGSDVGLCVCCGGFILTIDDDEKSFYHFEMLPENSNIDYIGLNLNIPVKLNWSIDRECGPFTYIIIESIELY